jgi:hypothetical protein
VVEPDQFAVSIILTVEIVLAMLAGDIELAIIITANDFEFTVWHAREATIGEPAIAGLEGFQIGPSALLDATLNAPLAISLLVCRVIHASSGNRSQRGSKVN